MAISPDQLQLLFERQQQRFRNSQLNVLDNLRSRLLNHPCFGDVTEVDKLISNLHTELEIECSTYECVDKSLYESLVSSNVSEAVIHDPPRDPEISIPETCPVVGSNPTAPEAPCTNSSQEIDVLFNANGITAVAAHEQTENKSTSIIKTDAPNAAHHSMTIASDQSTYRGSLVVLSGMSYLNDSHAFDQISYKNEKNLSDASNVNQEPRAVLLNADYHSDSLSTKDSNSDDFELNGVYPHYLVCLTGSAVQNVLNTVKLIVIWVYEDPTLFRGGGWTRETYIPDIRSGSSKKGRCWGIQKIPQKLSSAIPE
ncbi:unnamed protein product [Schistosoma spindalis]|nr:unnamed protein product [Schistosoma spindale]